MTSIYETACRIFQAGLYPDLISFLHSRYGFTEDTIRRYRLGFSPVDDDAFLMQIFEHHTREEMRVSGLFHESGDGRLFPVWRGRIMFPYLVSGIPQYFIGRRIPEVTTDDLYIPEDERRPKYKKQLVHSKKRDWLQSKEPVFGIDSVKDGEPLIITEGVADCISVHQAGYPAISPVTVQFKEDHAHEMYSICKNAGRIVIIMDNETNKAGTLGAVRTGLKMEELGLSPYMADIPRPDELDKVDLNDFIKTGGNLSGLIKNSYPVSEHPEAQTIMKEKWKKITREKLIPQCKEVYFSKCGTKKRKSAPLQKYPLDIVSRYLPSVETLTGLRPGTQGAHPVYGSSTGTNLRISSDGDRWFCYHRGNEGNGDALKWISVYHLHLIHESEELTGSAFLKTIRYAWDTYVPDQAKEVVTA
ncbi:toprim domain-containing protein [Methanospirillum stamsii]|uniref:DNA primase DNAG catalytic core N-terminal domain-containing protein n=1 Tax=Methanospirillum stamsii TaxID=1277351 RepID=A0A2V2NA54_9EURY|nr:toprim domain-containing protein [Methanospirillum stamsii]PWR73358.1 hypothetical protein DLD82_10860 [Methanospirillum stamsii]